MSSKAEKEKQRIIQDKCQVILNELLRDEDNKYCVDCDAKGPRWASWNIGIFLCIRCAGIHRNLGVHISKVKSVNLDSWTAEQVACLQQMGNSRARAVYEANVPDNFRRPQTDSSLEAFVRAKYEHKKYIAQEWVQPPMPKPAFELEEDKPKPKEKKPKPKTTTASSWEPVTLAAPAKSKPRQNSPSRSLNRASTAGPKEEAKNDLDDLLKIDDSLPSSDDPFGNFLSCPVSANNTKLVSISPEKKPDVITNHVTASAAPPSSSLEESFFQQTSAPIDSNEDPAKKLSNESIMSLYKSQNPSGVQNLGGGYADQLAYQQISMVGGVMPHHQGPYNIQQSTVNCLGNPNPELIPRSQCFGQMRPSDYSLLNNPFLTSANMPGVGAVGLSGFYSTTTNQTTCFNVAQLQQQLASMSIQGASSMPYMGQRPMSHVGPQPNMGVGGTYWPLGRDGGPVTMMNSNNMTSSSSGRTLSNNLWQ